MKSALSFTDHFELLADRYDVLLCDAGRRPQAASSPFRRRRTHSHAFAKEAETVVLITNAPRPGTIVGHYLDELGLPRTSYDAIMASGDVTRGVIAKRRGIVCDLGPERDLPIFQGLDLQFAPPDRADFAVCTGLFNDDTEHRTTIVSNWSR